MAASIVRKHVFLRFSILNSFRFKLYVRKYTRGVSRNIISVMTSKEERANSQSKSAIKPYKNPVFEQLKSQRSKRPLTEIENLKRDINETQKHSFNYEHLQKSDRNFGFSTLRPCWDQSFPELPDYQCPEDYRPMILDAKSRSIREKKQQILLEGQTLICDAIKSGVVIKAIYFSKIELLQEMDLKDITAPLYKVMHKDLKYWSDMVTPQGIMAVCKMPDPGELSETRTGTLPLTLICDNIRDPGNMGSLIRIAAAVGCQKILTSKGCVDIWDPKVIRSGAGSHFVLPVFHNLSWPSVSNYLPENAKVFLADPSTYKPAENKLSSEDALKLLQTDNVQYTEQPHDGDADDDDDDDDDDSQQNPVVDEDTLEVYKQVPFLNSIYSDIDYANAETVLIVSNESTGPSAWAKKLTFDNFGQSVTVPMCESVQSLNSAMAAAVIMYEIRRQMMLRADDKQLEILT